MNSKAKATIVQHIMSLKHMTNQYKNPIAIRPQPRNLVEVFLDKLESGLYDNVTPKQPKIKIVLVDGTLIELQDLRDNGDYLFLLNGRDPYVDKLIPTLIYILKNHPGSLFQVVTKVGL